MSSPFFRPGKHHAVWKEWKRIGKGKDLGERFFLEHRQAVLESLESGRPPEQVLLSLERHAEEPEFWNGLAARHPAPGWYLLDGKELNELVSVPSSSGLCGVFAPQPVSLDQLMERPFLLVAWEVADPGNLGTLIRATRALTGGGMLVVGGCSPWSSKVARSSAGCLLKTRLAQVDEDAGRGALRALQAGGFRIFAAFPRAELTLDRLHWSGKDAVVLGNETRGLPRDLCEYSEGFTVPTVLDVESLNVAMAGSITAWEWSKTKPAIV